MTTMRTLDAASFVHSRQFLSEQQVIKNLSAMTAHNIHIAILSRVDITNGLNLHRIALTKSPSTPILKNRIVSSPVSNVSVSNMIIERR
jgi:hypothetical protein